MRIEQLEYVLEIARQKSFSIAAQNLHVSQQSLSQSIRSLENELEVEVFTRSNRGVHQTDEGELVIDFARDVLARYDHLRAQLHGAPEAEEDASLTGRLIVLTCRAFYLSFLPDAVKAFLKRHPQVALELVEQDSRGIYAAMEAEKASHPDAEVIGLVNLPYADEGILGDFSLREGYEFQPITSGKFKLMVSKDSELASHKQITAKRLAQHSLIQYRTSQFENTPLCHLLAHYGYETPHIALSVDSFELWVEAIKNDLGVGFMHEAACRKSAPYYQTLQQLQTVNIKEVWGGTLGCLSDASGSLLVAAFLNCFPDHPKR